MACVYVLMRPADVRSHAGLDATMSYDLIRVLKSIAVKEHRTIMCSIHQPSSQVFYTFNSIVLLMEGKVEYID